MDMKLLLLTNDLEIKKIFQTEDISTNNQLIFFENQNPLEILSFACNERPSLLILDDDFVSPNSAQIIKSIKNLCKNIAVIFITSDAGLDLGRQVSQLGIQYYTIKPISNDEIIDSVNSIIKLKSA